LEENLEKGDSGMFLWPETLKLALLWQSKLSIRRNSSSLKWKNSLFRKLKFRCIQTIPTYSKCMDFSMINIKSTFFCNLLQMAVSLRRSERKVTSLKAWPLSISDRFPQGSGIFTATVSFIEISSLKIF